MRRTNDPAKFLSPEEKARVEAAVAAAEHQTSAEIKVILVRHCWGSIKAKAASVFRKHGLDRTALRNCVLILLVTTNREFLIYGDQGIHEKAGQSLWDGCRDEMTKAFKEDRFGDGLETTVLKVGEKLAAFFPHQADDRNEISDEVGHEE